jgi:hypothetical protein
MPIRSYLHDYRDAYTFYIINVRFQSNGLGLTAMSWAYSHFTGQSLKTKKSSIDTKQYRPEEKTEKFKMTVSRAFRPSVKKSNVFANSNQNFKKGFSLWIRGQGEIFDEKKT